MPRRFDRTTGWMVDHPSVVTFGLLVISGFALLGYIAPERLTDLFRVNEPNQQSPTTKREKFETPPDVDPVSLSDSDAVLVVDCDAIFTQRGAAAVRHVVDELESLDYVRSILWMDRVPILNIFGLPEPILPSATASAGRFEAARKKADAHPLVAGQLLSDDGKTLLLLIKFDWLFVSDDEDCTSRLREEAEKAAADFLDVKMSFLVSGRVPTYLTIVQSHEENKYKYQIIGYSMIGLIAIVLFRGFTAVIIVALAPAMGVFWTLGMLQYFDLQNNPFNDVILPVLLSLVGLTDGVHLMVQIRRYRASGMSERDAARAGVREVGLACALTSLTTAIGFGSMSLAHHKTVQEFGWSCVMGVLLTFVAVVTVIPLACSTRMGRRVHIGHERGLIDRHLNRIGGIIEFVLRHTKAISYFAIGLTFVLLMISLTLRPDERRTDAMPTGSEAAVAMRHMDDAFGGLEYSAVDISWPSDVPADSPKILEAVSAVDDLLLSEELIGHPLSIRNLIDALPGEGKASERMSMIELLPPPLKRAFYTPERRRASVTFRVRDLGIAKYGPVFRRLEAGLEEIHKQYPNFTFNLSGSAVRRWKHLYQIVVDLAASLGSAAIIIFVVLAFVYRSVRMGLISIIPNVFPLAVTGTALALTGGSLEMVSVCAFTVCLGIAVDDTIHFLTRYQEEREKTDDDHEAIRAAFTGVGTALIMTTAVLMVGFSTVLLSDMRDQRIFAAMSGLTIGSALFGDLVFLPALLSRFARAKPKSDSGVDETPSDV
ncbi:multidrug efflux system subunit MdtC [Symmachiella dynata]|uniref:Multidrug efflux system subunit MdtC n=1 Tax=Symmachiella dynata TaxID=2527995 RepID=A0A517ZLU2_9PLAN|nr:efflux RND transporter permease subunit [Symmachiella dynata]QDU43456.1 multidrug efflux system subunit MdtC [Symmachiella dynata]